MRPRRGQQGPFRRRASPAAGGLREDLPGAPGKVLIARHEVRNPGCLKVAHRQPGDPCGFEWGMHGSNRRNSDQDNQSHRWQFGAYYFF